MLVETPFMDIVYMLDVLWCQHICSVLFFIQVVFNHKKIIKTLPRSGILYYMQYLKLEVDLTILSRFYKIFWSFDIIPKRRG